MRKILNAVVLGLCFVGAAGVQQAIAADTFLLIPGIQGSSTDRDHPNWIEVISLSHGLQQVRRQPQCSLDVTKSLDIAGPLLWGAAASGQAFAEIQIDVTKPGERRLIIYKIKLLNAHIKSISTAGNDGGGYFERVTLDAGSVELTFVPQRPDGSLGTPVVSSFAC